MKHHMDLNLETGQSINWAVLSFNHFIESKVDQINRAREGVMIPIAEVNRPLFVVCLKQSNA